MGQQAPSSNYFRRFRLSREFFLLATVVLALASVFGLVYATLSSAMQPKYITLDVQPPNALEHWLYIEETVWTWQGNSNKQFFLWRTGTEAYNAHGTVNGQESLLRYFDQWLTTHGWKQVDGSAADLCGYLPGKTLREMRGDQFVSYMPANNSDLYPTTACIGVWPIDPKSDAFFQVELVTLNPSPLARLTREFEP